MNKIDHVAVYAGSLAQAGDAKEDVLGVTIPAGSKQDPMGANNCTMQSGEARLLDRPRALLCVAGPDDFDAVFVASPVDVGALTLSFSLPTPVGDVVGDVVVN